MVITPPAAKSLTYDRNAQELVTAGTGTGTMLYRMDDVPSAYSRVEYLETTGTQYIDTGYVPAGSGVQIGGELTILGYVTTGSYLGIWTAYTSENANTFRIIRNNRTNNALLIFHNTKANGGGSPASFTMGQKYHFDFNDTDMKFGASTYSRSASQGTANTASIKIGAANVRCRFYSFYVFKDGVKVLDLVPVVYQGVGYMYDKVSDSLMGDSNGNNFTLGPEWSTNVPVATNAGSYTVAYKAAASDKYTESGVGTVNVTISAT